MNCALKFKLRDLWERAVGGRRLIDMFYPEEQPQMQGIITNNANLMLMPQIALQTATAILVGQQIGANNIK